MDLLTIVTVMINTIVFIVAGFSMMHIALDSYYKEKKEDIMLVIIIMIIISLNSGIILYLLTN